jgi:phage terminase large subunit
MIIIYCQKNIGSGKKISIFRAKLTWTRDSVYHDFLDILNEYEFAYDLNKSEMTITLFGCEITFRGLDDYQRLKGLRQHVAWINEATDTKKMDYDQIALRTSEKIILDYNPNISQHYVYDLNSQNVTNKDYLFFISKPTDNPFLDKSTRELIRSWNPDIRENVVNNTANENLYKVYGLGLKGTLQGLVFPDVTYISEFPKHLDVNYGLDIGFTNDPTALVKCGYESNKLYIELMLYDKGMTTDDISKFIASNLQRRMIYADSAEPRLIHELSFKHKHLITGVKKTTILSAIDLVNTYSIYIVDNPHARIEQESYRYKQLNGEYINEPIDSNNHMWDAVRYYAISVLASNKPRKQKYNSRLV